MENISKLMYMGLGVILFCTGAFLLISGTRKYLQTVETIRYGIKDKDVLYQQYINEDGITTYGELIGMLLQRLEYDIEVDGFMIYRSTHSPEKIQSYNIARSEYKKEYRYDSQGNIYKIVFNKIV